MKSHMKRNKLIIVVLFAAFMIITVSFSYTILLYTMKGYITNIVTTNAINFTYLEGNNNLTIENAIPVSMK